MRIISGTLRGKTIAPPSRFKARPTTDFAKESLFNILENRYDFTEMRALDLFAGTGSIGMELASRGCPHIDAVEMNAIHASFIKKMACTLKLRQLHVVHINVFDFINICTSMYDLIFADPPYDMAGINNLPEKIISKLLNNNGCMILEHAATYNFDKYPYFTECRHYGAVNFSFFIKT